MSRSSFVRCLAFAIVLVALAMALVSAFDINTTLTEMTQADQSGLDDWLMAQIIHDHPLEDDDVMSPAEHRKFLEAHGYDHSKFFTPDGKLNAPSLGQMQLAAQLSGAAYCVSRNAQALADWVCKACPTSIKMQTTSVWNFSGFEMGAYAGYDATNKVIRVVFRGSSNFSNWMANLVFAKTSLGSGRGEVHTGFRTAYAQVRSALATKVSALRSQYGSPPVQITGHSLGGAVALLCAIDFKSGVSLTTFSNGLTHVTSELFPEPLPFNQAELQSLGATTTLQTFPVSGPVITFGQPRVGDSTFARFVSSQLATEGYFRVTHRYDPVPRVPTQSMGFAHANPTEIYFKDADGSTNYKICAGGSSEDPTCILSPIVNLSIGDHSWYAGVFLSQNDQTCARR